MEGRWKNPPKVPENTWLLVVAAGWAWSTRILFKKEQNNNKKKTAGFHGEENGFSTWRTTSAFLIWEAGDKRTSGVGSPGRVPTRSDGILEGWCHGASQKAEEATQGSRDMACGRQPAPRQQPSFPLSQEVGVPVFPGAARPCVMSPARENRRAPRAACCCHRLQPGVVPGTPRVVLGWLLHLQQGSLRHISAPVA